MKTILIFNPPTGLYRRDNRCQNRIEDQTVQVVLPPMELLYPAAILEREGHTVYVRDYPALHGSWDDFEEAVRSLQPDIIILTVTIATLESDLSAAQAVKRINPKILVAAKGEPLEYLDHEIIRKTTDLDLILRGEVEGYLGEFVSGKAWENLPSVTWIESGVIKRTRKTVSPIELDSLPFPSRHLINNDLYRSPETGNRLTTVVTSLGCPYKCIFCSVPAMTGTDVRYRSHQSVVNELEHCVSEYGIREFLFHADTFTLNKRWVIELCQEILIRKLDIRWGCNSRVNSIDDERLRWMKKAGCWVVGFGVESGNDQHLEWMKKGATADQAKEAIRLCREHDIRSHTFFVFGFPWDTIDSIKELIHFARDLDPDFFDFNVAFPLPGTEFDAIVDRKKLVVRERLRSGGYAVSSVSTESLSADELDRWRKKALWQMYLRPHYILRTFWNAGSPAVAFNYLKAATNRIRNLLTSDRSTST